MSETDKQRERERKVYVFCGLISVAGVAFWTESWGAIFATVGLIALISECTMAIVLRLDTEN